jgi:L-ascorbate metabolism protein UlaG (beta-lactamase superfamily)
MQITMIGHSTTLIETGGQRILTDPYFSAGGEIAYRRLAPPARKREELLDVQTVLVSHNHPDHVDGPFFRLLSKDVPVLGPRTTALLTRLQGARHVVGMRVWETRDLGGVKITAVPAIHWAIAIGFVLEGEGKRVYFAGDTFYGSFMAEIGRRFPLDVALIPVTTYRTPMTMGEQGAVRAVADLASRVVIPIHLGLQPRSPLLRTGQSAEGFARRLAESGSKAQVVLLKEGGSWSG